VSNKVTSSILSWLITGLVIVAVLPFLLSWYQINSNLDGIVLQTQQTHSVYAQSVASRIGTKISVFENLLLTAGDQEALYLSPQSEQAGQAVANILQQTDDALAIGLFQRSEGKSTMIYSANRPHAQLDLLPLVGQQLDAKAAVISTPNGYLLRVQRQTTRPNLFLTLIIDFAKLTGSLNSSAIGDEAELLLISNQGAVLYGSAALFEEIPPDFRDQLTASDYDGSTSFRKGDSPIVYAYANAPNMDLKVISIQPAKRAEQARTFMQNNALKVFLIVLAIILALSVGAWYLIINPIRKIISSQRRLLNTGVHQPGNEIAQLERSFQQMQDVISDRDSLSEVFFERYQVLKRLGSGAMGAVYLAWDPKLKRHAALKTVKPASDRSFEERKEMSAELVREAVTSAALTHQNIVTIYDVTSNDESAFIAMEYVDGESLAQRLKRVSTLSVADVTRYTYAILRGLHIAHSHGVIHRDIKPANIMIAKDETIKISDFGIACFVSTTNQSNTIIKGSPGYLAPECLLKGQFSPQSDLFAVGVLMVKCLQGKIPFGGKNTQQIITRTLSREVPVLEKIIPQPMQKLIFGLLQKDTDKRIASAQDALHVLKKLVGQLQENTEDDTPQSDLPINENRENNDSNDSYNAVTQRHINIP